MKRKRFLWAVVGFGGLLLIGLVVSVAFFLHALLLGGPWPPFLWALGFSLGLIVVIKFLAFALLDDKWSLEVTTALWQLIGGVTGWTWIVLAISCLVVFGRAVFLGGSWTDFALCLLGSTMCKWFTRHAMTMKQAAIFMTDLVETGVTKEEARRAWIARARATLRGTNESTAERPE